MIAIVVVMNMLLALILFYTAWQVWRLQRKLANIADILIAAERSTHTVLYRAPEGIYIGQWRIRNLRQGNQPLRLQIQQIQQIFRLLVFGQQVWRRHFLRLRSNSLKKEIQK